MLAPAVVPEVLTFEPYFRPQVWGGQRLKWLLGKSLPPGSPPIGESWELSGLPQQASRVNSGPLAGRSVNDLWSSGIVREALPAAFQSIVRFPWLIKFLDCQQTLSVQVHPNDLQARELGLDEVGKTEAWYILHADPGSVLYLGWRSACSASELRQRQRDGSLAATLQRVEPRPGDVFLVPAGTVHAIGAGIVLCEVQQPSDATLRLFDWGRRDANGEPRALHFEEALTCLDWSHRSFQSLVGRPLIDLPPGVTGRRRVTCDYFQLDEYQLDGPSWRVPPHPLATWILVSGACELVGPAGIHGSYRAGQTWLFSSPSRDYQWRRLGDRPATFLCVTPPTLEADFALQARSRLFMESPVVCAADQANRGTR